MLVGVEAILGLVQANAVARAMGEGLKLWFSFLPKPKSIQSDNGSHFSARVVQEWAKPEGIQWTFHTPYYPQANRVVERSNGLLKCILRPHDPGWSARIPDAIARVNGQWGINGCPRLTPFCPTTSFLLPGEREEKDPIKPLQYPGQPVLVYLPTVGEVPLTLKTLRNACSWVAVDAHGKEHKINTSWIVPSF